MRPIRFVLPVLVLYLLVCAPASAQTTEYAILQDSSAVSVDGTSNSTPEWTVYATEFTGGVTLVEDDPARVASAKLVVSAPMMKSRKSPIMDRGMHAALKSKEFTTITFELTEVSDVEQTSEAEFLLTYLRQPNDWRTDAARVHSRDWKSQWRHGHVYWPPRVTYDGLRAQATLVNVRFNANRR